LLAATEFGASALAFAPGGSFTLTASNYRAGEAVVFTSGNTTFAPVIAATDGTAVLEVDPPTTRSWPS
jgi:hypothetical protein